jgi:hypothetical protein
MGAVVENTIQSVNSVFPADFFCLPRKFLDYKIWRTRTCGTLFLRPLPSLPAQIQNDLLLIQALLSV